MASEYRLEHDVLTKIWRRAVTPAAALFATAPGTNGLSVIDGTLKSKSGHWVRFDPAGSDEVVAAGAGAAARGAMPIWGGADDRLDIGGGISVVWGDHVASTSEFKVPPAAGSYNTVGTELTLVDDGSGNMIIDVAQAGDYVIATVEAKPTATTPAFVNGLLRISTRGVGYIK